jgi:uncharacterized membrane protein
MRCKGTHCRSSTCSTGVYLGRFSRLVDLRLIERFPNVDVSFTFYSKLSNVLKGPATDIWLAVVAQVFGIYSGQSNIYLS